MTTTVDFVEAGLAALLDRTPAGEEIILADAGKPYARVVKLDFAADASIGRGSGGWPSAVHTKHGAKSSATEFRDAPQLGPRQPGGWPELANIPDSVWFDPLPDDELDAWEGKYSNIL